MNPAALIRASVADSFHQKSTVTIVISR